MTQKSTHSVQTGAPRGFAAMDPELQRQIASKGGRAAHQQGTAHEFTPQEAAEAGRKGGQAVSQDREHMAAIGAEGGRASRSGHRQSSQSSGQSQQSNGTQSEIKPRPASGQTKDGRQSGTSQGQSISGQSQEGRDSQSE